MESKKANGEDWDTQEGRAYVASEVERVVKRSRRRLALSAQILIGLMGTEAAALAIKETLDSLLLRLKGEPR